MAISFWFVSKKHIIEIHHAFQSCYSDWSHVLWVNKRIADWSIRLTACKKYSYTKGNTKNTALIRKKNLKVPPRQANKCIRVTPIGCWFHFVLCQWLIEVQFALPQHKKSFQHLNSASMSPCLKTFWHSQLRPGLRQPLKLISKQSWMFQFWNSKSRDVTKTPMSSALTVLAALSNSICSQGPAPGA